ncbi:M20/M25/M40 family metallo-hydrolase [Blastococcus saxobsidens]|uniref:Acetylornithine deacetylase/succinyl-diaminopimelate desuccinylase-like protein n=1 Tax=Blastococcus saxobsidens TaxID=138336 RepID=A0A4Q7Y2G9_9ACTN|nr:M20/M25/M40 family metallo-hydrolase [Blastococcus saxobsidens]RZU31000.1 acetylornithine deacetylase/succinyl-diaminopimelate desuccinylase-like protein [Blastococcus saxobsidens]
MNEVVTDVLRRVESLREELSALTLRLGNTFGPFGYEAATAQQVHDWFAERRMPARLVPLTEDRASCVARLPGDGTGPSLVFNAHLDTEASGPEYDRLMAIPDPNKVGARIEDGVVYGHVAQNDRACMAAQMIAAAAIHDSGVTLRGDVVVKAVLGETGAAPVDEYEGLSYVGKGTGTEHLIQHGYRPDYAIISETTDFAPCWVQTGAIYAKVTVRGRNMYTPRLVRGDSLPEHPNAIVKLAVVIDAIEEWGIRVQKERTHETACGTMEPKAQVGAVRGGLPWRPNRSAPYAAVYVDIRTVPGEDTEALVDSLRGAIAETGIAADVEVFMEKSGHTADAGALTPVLDALDAAHRVVRGEPMPTTAETAVVSMWRDTNVYNRMGVPALTFGPGRGKASVQGTGGLAMSELLDAAKIYALTMLQVCAGAALDDA